MASGTYLLLCRDGAALVGQTSFEGCGFEFGVSADDTISLYASAHHTAPLDVATGCCAGSLIESYGRASADGSGGFSVLNRRTPGTANTGPAAPSRPPPPPLADVVPSTLIINEVADIGAAEDLCAGSEWVEIFNPTSSTWALSGIALVDGALAARGTPRQLQLGAPHCPQSLAPGKFLVLCARGPVFVGRRPRGVSDVHMWDEHLPADANCSFLFRIAPTDTIGLYLGTSSASAAAALLDATEGCCAGSSSASYGRVSADGTGGFSRLPIRTPGAVNVLLPPSPPPVPLSPPTEPAANSSASLGASNGDGDQSTAVIIVLSILVVALAGLSVALLVTNNRRRIVKGVKMPSSGSFPSEIAMQRTNAADASASGVPRA
jgi:hypothetical protein